MPGIPDAICWHEGMALMPQHFQQQDLRTESLSTRHAQGAHPWFWGVTRLEIDESKLGSLQVLVTDLHAVMPDGMVVDLDRVNDKDPVLKLQLTDEDLAHHDKLMIYLAIAPLWRGGLLTPWKDRLRSPQEQVLPDLASGEFAQPIQVMRPRMHLVTEAERGDSICLPLLHLNCEDLRCTRLRYQPPTPCLTADSEIGRDILGLCAKARHKTDLLTAQLRRTQEDGKISESLEIRLQLSAIWAVLPLLEANLDTRIAHPVSLYLNLISMAGALANLDPQHGIPLFKPLRYETLDDNFSEVIHWLGTKLASIRVGFSRQSFQYEDKRFFIELPNQASPEQQLTIGLRMPSGASAQAGQEWLERALIGSGPQLPSMQRRRMQGLSFKALERNDPIAYSVGDSIRLFSLQARGEWFQPNEPLYLFVLEPTALVQPSEIILFDASKLD